jgi:Transposase and inactivated derivatives, IS30 family
MVAFITMGCKQALSGMEKGQILAYKKEGLSSREIARRIDKSPIVVNNFLKLGNTYSTKKSSGRPRKLTPRQKRKVIRHLSAGRTSLGKLAKDPNIQVYKSRMVARSKVL